MAAATKKIEHIYEKYSLELINALTKKEANTVMVEDAVQDAFIKLYFNLKNGKEILNIKGWLYRVASNLLIDQYRNQKKAPKTEFKADLTDLSSKEHGPEDCLMGIVANLPNKYKKAVYLTDIKGIPQKDSAQKLKLTLSTFKSHVQRGRKMVTQGYVDCCDYKIDEKGHLQGESKDWQECKVCNSDLS